VYDNYHLTLRLTSGKVVDAGYVRGPTGAGAGKGGRVTGAYIGGGGVSATPSETKLTSPTFTYSNGLLSTVTYAGGHTKTLNYNSDNTLNTVVSVINNVSSTKTLTYNNDGTLASIT